LVTAVCVSDCPLPHSQHISTGFRVLDSSLHQRRSAQRRSTKLCTMFGRLLGWYATYTFLEALIPQRNSARCKIHFASNSCVLLVRVPCSVTARHSSRARHLNFAAWNGTTELLLLIIFNRGRHLYSEGGHHVAHRPTF